MRQCGLLRDGARWDSPLRHEGRHQLRHDEVVGIGKGNDLCLAMKIFPGPHVSDLAQRECEHNNQGIGDGKRKPSHCPPRRTVSRETMIDMRLQRSGDEGFAGQLSL